MFNTLKYNVRQIYFCVLTLTHDVMQRRPSWSRPALFPLCTLSDEERHLRLACWIAYLSNKIYSQNNLDYKAHGILMELQICTKASFLVSFFHPLFCWVKLVAIIFSHSFSPFSKSLWVLLCTFLDLINLTWSHWE